MKKHLAIGIFLLIITGMAFSWETMQEYTDTINNPQKNLAVNEYAARIGKFIQQKCPPEYCKHVLIVGDDFVVPQERKINGTQIIYSDSIYATTTNRAVGEAQAILEGETEILIVIPSSNDPQIRQAIDTMKSNMATEYGLDAASFEERLDNEINCSVNKDSTLWNKSVMVIGENNSILNCSQLWKNSTQVFETFQSPWGYQTTPKKQIILIKTNKPEIIEDAAYILTYDNIDKNFRGRILDTDGDGWKDSEELLMHTDLLDKNDNYCARMPDLKQILEDTKSTPWWTDAIAELTGASMQKSIDEDVFRTQSLWSAPALITGVVAGGVLGITGGIESDIDFALKGIPQILGGASTIMLNPNIWNESANYTIDTFLDPLGTKCDLIKKGIDTSDTASQNYFNVVLPSLYEKSAETRPAIQADWDEDDKRAFDSGFVTAYHAGFILEQVIVFEKTTAEAAKALKEAEFLKPLTQKLKLTKLELIATFNIGWTAKAEKGLDILLQRTKTRTVAEKALQSYEHTPIKSALEYSADHTATALAKPEIYQAKWIKFVKESTYRGRIDNFGKVGENFVMDKAFVDDLILEGLNNKSVMKKLESRLGLKPGALSEAGEQITMIEFNNATQLGMKLPIAGTNEFYVKGGVSIGGVPERLIDGGLNLNQVPHTIELFNPR